MPDAGFCFAGFLPAYCWGVVQNGKPLKLVEWVVQFIDCQAVIMTDFPQILRFIYISLDI